MKFTNKSGQTLAALENFDSARNLVATLNNIQPNETRFTELAPDRLVAHTLYIVRLDVEADSAVVLNAKEQLVISEDLLPGGPSGKV
jgi:hypothetical protein